MRAVADVAAEYGLKVIEDAAEALGAMYYGRRVGSLGDVAAFSFYANKIITCGEGGMVLTDDDDLAARIRQLKGQGQDPNRRYWFPVIGYNYRMTNIQAALGLAQMENMELFIAARDEIAEWYRSELEGVSGISLPRQSQHERNVCWQFSVVLNSQAGGFRDQVMATLLEAGIETRPFFYPCHILPPYVDTSDKTVCSNAEWLSARGISLPTWVGMTRRQVRRVSRTLIKTLNASSCLTASSASRGSE
jgi:perosamine synthetase